MKEIEVEIPVETSGTETELLAASYEIGAVVEMAAWASGAIAARIDDAGKSVGSLTIDELRRIIRRRSD